MSALHTSIFKDHDVAETLSTTHEKYAVAPADKIPKLHCFVCKTYYIPCLSSQVDVENNRSNKTFTATTLSLKEIMEKTINLCSFGHSTKDDDCDFAVYVLDT